MLFRKKDESLAGISRAGLSKWYEALSDRDKVRVRRYAEGAPENSAFDMLMHIARGAFGDENYDFAAEICSHAAGFADTKMLRYEITNWPSTISSCQALGGGFGALPRRKGHVRFAERK